MMIIIPGRVITALTFPGIIAHEFAHHFFCDVLHIPVYKACYLQLSDPETAGYIIHKPAKNILSAFLISMGPLIINTGLCAIFLFPSILHFYILQAGYNPYLALLMWIGFSIGLHAIPSDTDMLSLEKSLHRLNANIFILGVTIALKNIFFILNKIMPSMMILYLFYHR